MTEWLARVYQVVKESAPERELALHVPASVEGCMSVGLDVLEWIRLGIVDAVIAQPSGMADPMSDFRPLVEATKGTATRVLAALQSRVNTDRIGEGTIEMMRAAACNYWAQGVDGIFVAHWFGLWPYGHDFYGRLRELPYPDVMAPKDKFYRLPTDTDRPSRPVIPPGTLDPLPAELHVGRSVSLRLTVSDDLPRWDAMGRVHEVLLRVRVVGYTEQDALAFAFNGKVLPSSALRQINRMYMMSAPRYRVGGQWFIFRLDRDNWPLKGGNSLEISLLKRDPVVLTGINVRDVELEVKYLMGKNFHRGFVDPDLGQYEHTAM